jgi:hypothetical protein
MANFTKKEFDDFSKERNQQYEENIKILEE